MFMSSEPGNGRRHPLNTAPEPNRPVVNNNSTPSPPQLWFVQNVHHLLTPMRIFWFSMSQLSFLIACGLFMETEFYRSATSHGGQARLLLFFLVPTGDIWLICLFFFSFCSAAHEKYRHHYILKSIGEFMVMLLVSLVILGIGHKPYEADDDVVAAPASAYDSKLRFSDVAGLLTCGFLTVVALCVINLLKPGHHYSVFEATATLTLHFGLEGSFYLSTVAVCLFVFVMLVIKNFLWRNVGRVEEATVNEQHRLAWIASEDV